MNKTYKKYINKVVSKINCSKKDRNRIREDLDIIINEKAIQLNETNPYILLGNPDDVAKEFAENMGVKLFSHNGYVSKTKILGIPLIQVNNHIDNKYTEYKSQKKIMGIPLIHINRKPYGVAKGIIAIGNISIGIISFGGISIGVISIGGVSLAILLGLGGVAISLVSAIGGLAIAGLVAIGGQAISNYISIGGSAISKEFAFGGYARAKIALGKDINAKVGFYKESGTGEFVKKVIDSPIDMKNYIYDKIPDANFIIKRCVDKFVHLIKNIS
ncbi:MAG: hypothetical protein N4A50_14005 [Vallitalea sp.]|jgi:hypothetical protein|nr:hypothetical protein [Vallitalea sp.]